MRVRMRVSLKVYTIVMIFPFTSLFTKKDKKSKPCIYKISVRHKSVRAHDRDFRKSGSMKQENRE